MITKFYKFLNEDNNEKYDSFKINVKYEIDYCELEHNELLLLCSLQKVNRYSSEEQSVNLEKYSFDYEPKNGSVLLKLMDSTNSKIIENIFEVRYNTDKDYYSDMDEEFIAHTNDDEEKIFNYVKVCINDITYYSYRTEYEMDDRKKTNIKIKSITKI